MVIVNPESPNLAHPHRVAKFFRTIDILLKYLETQ